MPADKKGMTLKKAALAALSAGLMVLLLAPAALAQELPGTGAVGDATGGVTDTIGDATGGVTDTIGDTTGTVGDTTGGTIDNTTDTIDNTTGTDTGGTIDNTTDTIDNTTGTDTGGTIDKTVDSSTGGGGSTSGGGATLDDLLGGGTGDGTPTLEDISPGVIDEILDKGAALGLSPAAAEGWVEGKKVMDPVAIGRTAAALVSIGNLVEDFASGIVESDAFGSGTDMTLSSSNRESFFADAGRAAVTAAKALAFPVALALLVVGFLAVQGRIGRKDPKLVLAPVSATEDTLTFE